MPTHAIATTGEQVDPATGQLAGYMTKYKSYVALITQDGTDAPVADVLNSGDSNFLGTITWSYDIPGHYYGQLQGAFNRRTVIFFHNNQNCFTSAARFGDGDIEDFVELNCWDVNYVGLDSKMYKGTIEIRVYE